MSRRRRDGYLEGCAWSRRPSASLQKSPVASASIVKLARRRPSRNALRSNPDRGNRVPFGRVVSRCEIITRLRLAHEAADLDFTLDLSGDKRALFCSLRSKRHGARD